MQAVKMPKLSVPDIDPFVQSSDQPFDSRRKIRQRDKTRRKLMQLGAQKQLKEGILHG